MPRLQNLLGKRPEKQKDIEKGSKELEELFSTGVSRHFAELRGGGGGVLAAPWKLSRALSALQGHQG